MYRVSMNGYTKYSGDYNWIAVYKNGSLLNDYLHWNKANTTMHTFVSHEVIAHCSASDYLEAFQLNANGIAADLIDTCFVTFELIG